MTLRVARKSGDSDQTPSMDAYAAARARGRNEIAATMDTYRTDGSCSSAE